MLTAGPLRLDREQSCGSSLSYNSLPYIMCVNVSYEKEMQKSENKIAPVACRDVFFTENYPKSSSPQVLLYVLL